MSKPEGKILIVDDNDELLVAFKLFLSPHFKEIRTIRNPNQIPNELSQSTYDVVLLDMNFSAGVNTGNEGFFWMKRVLEIDPEATIVFITAYGDVEMAVKAMKEGAADFIQKSWDDKKILSTILAAYKLRQSKLQIKNLKNKQKHLSDKVNSEYDICIGESQIMQDIMLTIDKVAKTDANILILGENGTGKEVIARQIHQRSMRKDEIFVNVDVGALPETLFESELFGHVKGAFTDAKSDRTGRFEIATGGTLFLDEIGNIPMPLQAKLLTAIQNKEVTRIGDHKPVSVDIRLICATNSPIYQLAEEGGFREDLLYRINTIQIELPPLRDRQEDIPILAEFFLKKFVEKYNKEEIAITKPALELLKKHSWKGNIRELQHVLEKAVILNEGQSLKPSDFSLNTIGATKAKAADEYNLEVNEKQIIEKALAKFGSNISLTAQKLGINRSTLYAKMKRYGIE